MRFAAVILPALLALAGCKKGADSPVAPAGKPAVEQAAASSESAPTAAAADPKAASKVSAGAGTGDASGAQSKVQGATPPAAASGQSVAGAGEGRRPPPANAADYKYLGGPSARFGPPSPPVGRWEKNAAADLSAWTEIPLHDPSEGEGPTRFKTFMDAATDVAAVSHSGQVIYELTRSSELEPLYERVARELEYTDLLRLSGAESTLGAYPAFREKISAQIAALGPQYGEFVGPTGRKDRVVGMLSETEMARISRWTFEYKDKADQPRTGCYLFLLTAYNWMLLDMECDTSPFSG